MVVVIVVTSLFDLRDCPKQHAADRISSRYTYWASGYDYPYYKPNQRLSFEKNGRQVLLLATNLSFDLEILLRTYAERLYCSATGSDC